MADPKHLSEKDIVSMIESIGDKTKRISYLEGEFAKAETEEYDLITKNRFGRFLGDEIRNYADSLIASRDSVKLEEAFKFLEDTGNRYHGRDVSGNNLGADLHVYLAELLIHHKRFKKAIIVYELLLGDSPRADALKFRLDMAQNGTKPILPAPKS